ncbi:MAG: DNA-processing protein DprA [Acidimicrobiales bacterium]
MPLSAVPNERDVAIVAALAGLPGMGPVRLRAVLAQRSPAKAYELLTQGRFNEIAELKSVPGLRADDLATWRYQLSHLGPSELLAAHADLGIEIDWSPEGVSIGRLRDDPDPPLMIFQLGANIDTQVPSVAIVGTRRCTAYGRSVAARLGSELADAGVTVVSGVATGIDGAAQRSALDSGGGAVIGIVGSGLDVVYPQRHRSLWADLARYGTLLSEYPVGTPPARWRFPARNRLIAALADIVVVVESGERGGSLHTVESALERDRLVMAVPGPITNPASIGTNRLLGEGCPPVTCTEDILAALGFVAPALKPNFVPEKAEPQLESVLEAMGWEPATIDELLLRTSLGLDELGSRLMTLRVAGKIVETGGWWERNSA